MYNVIQKNELKFKSIFCYKENPLTAADINNLFSLELSEEGSNKRVLESRALCYFRDFLMDCEGEIINKKILASHNPNNFIFILQKTR